MGVYPCLAMAQSRRGRILGECLVASDSITQLQQFNAYLLLLFFS